MSEPAICLDCGLRYGRTDRNGIGTFWEGVCSWCGRPTSVTSPSDYGYPKLPEQVSK
jgi:hypothetical protein